MSGLVQRICVLVIFQQNINTLNDAAADPWDKPKDDGSVAGSLAQTGVSCTLVFDAENGAKHPQTWGMRDKNIYIRARMKYRSVKI
jgi:hypothetical protein